VVSKERKQLQTQAHDLKAGGEMRQLQRHTGAQEPGVAAFFGGSHS
jgi:hypothetical protein